MSSPYLRCQECRELLPAERFPVKVSNRSGRRGICLTCRPEAPAPPLKPTRPMFSKAVRHAMCGKKRRYGNEGKAYAAAVRSARRTVLIRVYPCPICQGFHLTHQPKKEVS